jgi:hypothetical protein
MIMNTTVQAQCPLCNGKQPKKTAMIDEYFRCIHCFQWSLKKDWKVIVPATTTVPYGDV